MLSRWITLVVLSMLVTAAAPAQTFEQLTNVRLDSSSASVRSAAMGGAADATNNDVSLLPDNPTAAARLQHVTMSIAAAQTAFSTQAVRTSGDLGYSFQEKLNTTAISNFSIAAPLGNTVIGAYYRTDPRIRSNDPIVLRNITENPYASPSCEPTCTFLFGSAGGFDRRATSYGVTLSWRSNGFAAGGGAEMQRLDERSATERTAFVNGAPGFIYERVFRTTSGNAIVPHAALSWTINPRVVVAAGYNGAGSFDRTTSVCGTSAGDVPVCMTQTAIVNESRQRSASNYRAGISVQIAKPLIVAASVVRRMYGSLAAEPFSLLDTPVTLPYRDVVETHAGAEYRFSRLALRAGWWHDPARFDDSRYEFTPFVHSADHMTFGAGLKLANAELSFAVDDPHDNNGRRASVGLTYAF